MKNLYLIAATAVMGLSLVSCSNDESAAELFAPSTKQQEEVFQNLSFENDYSVMAKPGDTIPPNQEGGGGTGEDGTIPVKPPKKP